MGTELTGHPKNVFVMHLPSFPSKVSLLLAS